MESPDTETVAQTCSVKKAFLEISCEFWEISKNTLPYRTPSVAASVPITAFIVFRLQAE